MVDEFSSFSRMPQAVLKTEDLGSLCRQALFLERNRTENESGAGAVQVNGNIDDDPHMLNCDAQQISRALTNILKNAVESVTERMENEPETGQPGAVSLTLKQHDTAKGKRTIITVEDNGTGLPETDMTRLTEPYVTTRDRGTGLGLAIVKKIMEDHGGNLILENIPGGGARVTLSFSPDNARSLKRP
jgi:two-component system nitrogen regulation sensor histidine kinase NtrY